MRCRELLESFVPGSQSITQLQAQLLLLVPGYTGLMEALRLGLRIQQILSLAQLRQEQVSDLRWRMCP
jgi:hypothetical protein